jgi:hypothetical protein
MYVSNALCNGGDNMDDDDDVPCETVTSTREGRRS